MSNIESLSADAFVAGWAQSIQELPARFPSIANDISLVCQFERRMDIVLKSSIPDNHSFADILHDTNNLQCKLRLECTKHTLSTFMQELESKRDRTRLRSLQERGAGTWLDAIPTSTKFALSSDDYRLATCVRLGCSMPMSSHSSRQSECGRRLDEHGFSPSYLQNRGWPVWSHNAITGVWAICLKTLSIPHHVKLRDRYANSNNRPDISVFDACIGTSYDLDISLVHSWNQDIIERAAKEDGFAAQAREELKEKKYTDKILAAGGHAKTVPLVPEHWALGLGSSQVSPSTV